MSDGWDWNSRLTRRSMLRGAGIAVAGLTGAALIGCEDDDDDDAPAPTAAPTAATDRGTDRGTNRSADRRADRSCHLGGPGSHPDGHPDRARSQNCNADSNGSRLRCPRRPEAGRHDGRLRSIYLRGLRCFPGRAVLLVRRPDHLCGALPASGTS